MNLLILGGGGYGRTVADLAIQLGCYDEIAFLDDGRTGEDILGQCDDFLKFADGNTWMYPAFGNNAVRMEWLHRLAGANIPVATLVHPRAYVSPAACLDAGVVVLPLAVVNTGCRVADGCILNLGAILDHDCVVEEGVHLAPGAIVKAENRIPALTKIESGVVIENRQYPL